MSFVSLLKKVFLILGLPLCFTGQAWALMATASVDKNRITMDETVTLYIEVLDDPYGRARQPRIQVPGFGVGSMGSSTRVLLQNGRMSTTRTYTYVLSPRLTGKLTIPAVRIDGGGEVTTTQPIIVEVVKGAEGVFFPGFFSTSDIINSAFLQCCRNGIISSVFLKS